MNRQEFDTVLNTLEDAALAGILVEIGLSSVFVEGLDRPGLIHRLHEEYSDEDIATLTREDVEESYFGWGREKPETGRRDDGV